MLRSSALCLLTMLISASSMAGAPPEWDLRFLDISDDGDVVDVAASAAQDFAFIVDLDLAPDDGDEGTSDQRLDNERSESLRLAREEAARRAEEVLGLRKQAAHAAYSASLVEPSASKETYWVEQYEVNRSVELLAATCSVGLLDDELAASVIRATVSAHVEILRHELHRSRPEDQFQLNQRLLLYAKQIDPKYIEESAAHIIEDSRSHLAPEAQPAGTDEDDRVTDIRNLRAQARFHVLNKQWDRQRRANEGVVAGYLALKEAHPELIDGLCERAYNDAQIEIYKHKSMNVARGKDRTKWLAERAAWAGRLVRFYEDCHRLNTPMSASSHEAAKNAREFIRDRKRRAQKESAASRTSVAKTRTKPKTRRGSPGGRGARRRRAARNRR